MQDDDNIQVEDPLGDVGRVPECTGCNSELVSRAAFVCWNPETGLWEIEKLLKSAYCSRCDGETTLRWQEKEGGARTRIRELNDAFRTQGRGHGTVVITPGIEALGPGFLHRSMERVRTFDSFTEHNDPWGEHDFGAFELEGQKVYWKLDCYDLEMTMGSPNPANEAVTKRVLTILLASEY